MPFCALIFTICASFVATILQYSSSFITSGFESDSTIFMIALVPCTIIPIHAISSLSSLISFITCCAFIFFLSVPTFIPFCSSKDVISLASILFRPTISTFQINFDAINKTKIINIISITSIFLFLYLCKKKGNPFFSSTLTLHFTSFDILHSFLKSFIPTFIYAIVDFSLFTFQKKIFSFMHLFTNFSTKYPSTFIFM